MKQYDVYLVSLDPTIGSELRKTRPCLIISPDEMNQALRTVMIAPMTTKQHPYPTRVALTFKGTDGYVCLDQIRTVDKCRLVKQVGRVSEKAILLVKSVIREMLVD